MRANRYRLCSDPAHVKRSSFVVGAIAALSLLVMCTGSTTVRVDRVPDVTIPDRARVSVFGVFHDGRMSEPAWLALAPKISHALDSPRCELGYSQQLRNAQPELAATIEKSVRENGIDDDLLARVAPFATGEFVMVLMSYRQIPGHRDGGAHAARPAPMMGRGGGRMRGAPRSSDYGGEEEDHVFELSASVYSVTAKKLVAQIDLRHTGDDLDEAMDAFALKLDALMPHARCVGWNYPDTPDVSASMGDAGSD